MKNSTKSKLLAVMLLPALLGGCASKAVPTVKANIGNPQIKDMYVVDGGGGGGSSSNYQSTGYPSVYGYETHVTTLLKVNDWWTYRLMPIRAFTTTLE
jgi:hypothetical protein